MTTVDAEDDPLLRCLRTQYGDANDTTYRKPLVQILVGAPVAYRVYRIEVGGDAPRQYFIRHGGSVCVFAADYVVEQPEMFVEIFVLKQVAYDLPLEPA